jgi:hypothetical protein
MDSLVKFENQVTKIVENENGDDLMDLYYQLTITCDVKLITDSLPESKRYDFLIKCGLLPEEIDYFNNFDTNYQNTLEYIIGYSKYDSIKYRIYTYLFSLFANRQIEFEK